MTHSGPDGADAIYERAVREAAPLAPCDLPRALRPREKLFAQGATALSHGELLALVLGRAGPGRTVETVAARLMRRHGLAGMARLSATALRRETGLGAISAARLCAALELGRRASRREQQPDRPTLSGPRAAFRQVRHLGRAKKEHLVGLYLDAQNGLLHKETISIGSLNTTRTHPREILYPAVTHLALGFILAHNHPSGCLDPSPEDVEFTRGVQRAAELMGIELYDHLIVAGEGYTSLRERGLL